MEKSIPGKKKSELMELHVFFSNGVERVFEGFSPSSISEWDQAGPPTIKAISASKPYWQNDRSGENKLFLDLIVLFSNSKKRRFFGLAPANKEKEVANIAIKGNIKIRRPYFIEDEIRRAIGQSSNDMPDEIVNTDEDLHNPDPWSDGKSPIDWGR